MGFFETIGRIAGEVISVPIKVVKGATEKIVETIKEDEDES